jgi:hypothetical protein
MKNKGVCIDVDGRMKKDYQLKLLRNGLTMAEHLRGCIRTYAYGKTKELKPRGVKRCRKSKKNPKR